MEVLKSMANSIDPRALMRVIKFSTFEEHGQIPRSDDKKTMLLSELPKDVLVRRLSFSSRSCPFSQFSCVHLLLLSFFFRAQDLPCMSHYPGDRNGC